MIRTCHLLPGMPERRVIIWWIGDGKPGHENQSLGLADALGRLVPCELHHVSIAGVKGLLNRVRNAVSRAASLPVPDIIIAAGHATHPSLLWLARKHAARSVVLMRPSLPMSWFGLCLVPEHDFPNGKDRPNLILTRGALNRVAPPPDVARRGGMILIGGPSASHGWDGGALLDSLAEVTSADPAQTWQLTDSRRTPAGFVREIRHRLPTIEVFPHQETTPDWLPSKLAAASEVWVTEDSVSMIYEALTSGANVGLLPVPRLGSTSRVLRGIESLVTGGFLTPFGTWRSTRQLPPPPEPFREADRCARLLLARFGL